MKRRMIRLEQTDSTNIQVRKLAISGAEEGTVVSAKLQTDGRGRRGRVWESPEGDNLYVSLLLRPDLATECAPMLTLVMAYSIALVLRRATGLEIQIKWPNDLVIHGKKICGILTEMYLQEQSIDYIIVGFGINVNQEQFGTAIRHMATSLSVEAGRRFDCEDLLEEILTVFEGQYEKFLKYKDLSCIQEQYNLMLVNRDREVRILDPVREYRAFALGIDEMGGLRVRTAEGAMEIIRSGEVSVRGIYGYI